VKIGRHEPGVDCYGNKKFDVACFRKKLELQLLVYIILVANLCDAQENY
jgi:hypothetical protein